MWITATSAEPDRDGVYEDSDGWSWEFCAESGGWFWGGDRSPITYWWNELISDWSTVAAFPWIEV